MRSFYTFSLIALSSTILSAVDPLYEAEFQRAIRLYPPGDYNTVPPARVSPITTIVKPTAVSTFNLLEPVEPPDKDIKVLFSEAATYFTIGRFDLAAKRYKQTLLLDPVNRDAKAHLFDILFLQSLWADESRRTEASKIHSEMSEQISKDIVPPKPQK